MGFRAFAAAALAVVVLAACSPAANREADAAARGLYAAVRSGSDLSSDNQLAESLRTPQALEELAQAREMIPKDPPTSVENRGWRYSTDTTGGHADLTHAYRYPDQTIVAETVLSKPPGSHTWLIVEFHVRVEEARPEQRPIRPDPALHPQRT